MSYLCATVIEIILPKPIPPRQLSGQSWWFLGVPSYLAGAVSAKAWGPVAIDRPRRTNRWCFPCGQLVRNGLWQMRSGLIQSGRTPILQGNSDLRLGFVRVLVQSQGDRSLKNLPSNRLLTRFRHGPVLRAPDLLAFRTMGWRWLPAEPSARSIRNLRTHGFDTRPRRARL
jgi:hypothetical protein